MSKRRILTTTAILASFAAGVVMAQAYRWTDAQGVVHYSDKPQEGAEEIILPERNRAARAAAASNNAVAAPEPAAPPPPFSYNLIQVRSPAAEETLWNIEGVLEVSLNVQPALQQNHQVRVYFDGEPTLVSGQNFQLQGVYRGVHNIQVEILDPSGQLMGRSQPNRFYIQQNTVTN